MLRNLRDLIQAASRYGDRVAFRQRRRGGTHQAVSYARFAEEVAALGTALIARGHTEAPVAILGENQYGWSLAYYALVCAGKVVVPLSADYSAEEVANLLRLSGAATLVASAAVWPVALAARDRLSGGPVTLVSMDTEIESAEEPSLARLLPEGAALLAAGERRFEDAPIDDAALMSLMFTSGTTGKAKGVMRSHRNLAFFLHAFPSRCPLDEDVRTLSVLPLHHILESAMQTHLLAIGATITFSDGIKYLEENLREVAPTFLVAVPLLVEHLYRTAMATPGTDEVKANAVRAIFGGRLRSILSSGAAFNPVVEEDLARIGMPVYSFYGSTEAICVSGNAPGEVRVGSVGRALPGISLQIDEPDEAGVGEILARTDSLMCGYFEDPAATAEAIRDGWFYTGDLGRLDADGFLYVTGRKKDVIVLKSGKKVYPEDLEALLNRSPLVLESMVYGQERPETGEVVLNALIVPRRPAIAERLGQPEPDGAVMQRVIADEVHALNRELPIYRQLAGFTLRSTELVKTGSRKLKRHAN
jgi:long-chain acyl-CoA synthetase